MGYAASYSWTHGQSDWDVQYNLVMAQLDTDLGARASGATSETSVTVGTPPYAFTLDQALTNVTAGSAWEAVSRGTSTAQIAGTVASYSGGVLTLTGAQTAGSGAHADWILRPIQARDLPSQTGNSGKYLTTDGSSASWGSLPGGVDTTLTASAALTSSSKSRQILNTSTLAQTVTEADATTLTKGLKREFKNINSAPWQYLDSTGAHICYIPPGWDITISLDDNSTAAGTWRVATGRGDIDNGYTPWGQSVDSTTRLTNSCFCQLQPDFGVGMGYDGTNCVAVAFQILDSGVKFGAKSSAIVTGGVPGGGTGGAYDLCRLSNTEAGGIVIPNAATSIAVFTIDLNTSTLAATPNTIANPSGGTGLTLDSGDGVCCDAISSTRYLVGYGDGTNTKCCTVDVSGGAVTPNTPGTVQSSTRSGPQPKISVGSTTLALMVYGNSAFRYDRIVLAGATVTPGSASSVSSRGQPLGLANIDGTHWRALCEGTEQQPSLYVEEFADSGSAVTPTETQLVVGSSATQFFSASGLPLRAIAVGNASGSLLLITQNGEGFSLSLVSGAAGSPKMSGAIPAGPVMAPNTFSRSPCKTYKNGGLLPFIGTIAGASNVQRYQPFFAG